MNKYVLRTSLIWMAVIAVAIGVYLYRINLRNHATRHSATLEPAAVGSAESTETHSDESESLARSDSQRAPIQLTPERMQSIGVQTGTVEWRTVANEIRATGTVDINERLISYVQVRFSGYVRKVFVNATYQYVQKGDPLFTIYSPELVAAENEYLLALRSENALRASPVEDVLSGANAMTAASESRLRQWEVSESEIASIRRTGAVTKELTVYAPASGYITERNAVPNLYVEPATRLYAVADLSRIWINAQVFQDDAGVLKPGDAASITVNAYPGRVFKGRIESLLPQVDLATRTVRVRLEMGNPELRLKPGMFVDAALQVNLGKQLVIPASAVLRSGMREIAFVYKGDGQLTPQEIVTGARAGDDLIVTKGLTAHQRIVTSANFLIDSESQLQAAAGSFAPLPPGASGAVQPANASADATNIQFSTTPAPPQKGNNRFRVQVSGPGGKPISGASVAVSFFMAAMPAMGMAAMNTKLELSSSSPGVYEAAGSLASGGTWQVTILVQKNGQTLATKRLQVSATGGM